MYFAVQHDITNTEGFWEAAQRNLPRLPEAGVKRVVSVFPNKEMDKCICVWEADSMETLENYFREKMGNASRNAAYEINEAAAFGPGL
ncbi:MAG TPA: hypothetical protein VMR70_12135 [Flavisolibacter sp.]|nr:hypothetical protein [Flavisolibacter sp.]